MYEELYEPLPDLDAYWSRLGIEEPEGSGVDELNRIIFAHQCSIPFENLDVAMLDRPTSLATRDMFEKTILGTRGGCCFELNALLCKLLAQTGFDAVSCYARTLKDRGYVQAVGHRATIVTIDGVKHFCDVGYGGPMPSCAIPLEDGRRARARGQVFEMRKGEGPLWRIVYQGRENEVEAGELREENVLEIIDSPRFEVDFLPLSHFAFTHPTSFFVRHRIVNLRTETGSKSIFDDTFTTMVGTELEQRTIESDADLRSILIEHFGIVLPG